VRHDSLPETNSPELEAIFAPVPERREDSESPERPPGLAPRGPLVRVALTVGAAAAVVIGLRLLRLVASSGFQTAAVAALALIAFDRLGRRPRWAPVFHGVLAACAGLAFKWLAPVFLGNWRHPHTWDFLAFYVDGSVGARGLDFYDPRSYQQIFPRLSIPFTPEAGFIEEIVNAAFKYPPMTMLLFAPLGHFEFRTAHVLWLSFVIASTVAAAIAVSMLLPRRAPTLARLLVATTLVCALPAFGRNSFYEQTGALLLALSAAVVASNGRRRAGVWAALAMCVKPVMAVAGIHLICRRHGRAALVAAGLLVAAAFAALLAFGPGTTLDYLRSGWMSRVPEWQYTGWTNQSLLGTMLRLDPGLPAAALDYPPFLVAAGWIAVLSIVIAWRLRSADADLSMGLLLCAGLLLYPGTLDSYSTLLLVPLIGLYVRRDAIPYGRYVLPAGIAIVYLLLSRITFAANALVWLVLLVVCFNASRRRREERA
jgi:hypothetical protein